MQQLQDGTFHRILMWGNSIRIEITILHTDRKGQIGHLKAVMCPWNYPKQDNTGYVIFHLSLTKGKIALNSLLNISLCS